MNQEKQRKLEALADCIDNIEGSTSELRSAAIEVVRTLKEDDAAAYMDAGKLFEAKVQAFQATHNKIMGDIARFSLAVREEALKNGFIKQEEIDNESQENEAEKDECPECKADAEKQISQEEVPQE